MEVATDPSMEVHGRCALPGLVLRFLCVPAIEFIVAHCSQKSTPISRLNASSDADSDADLNAQKDASVNAQENAEKFAEILVHHGGHKL